VAANDFPGHWPGESNAWDIQTFKKVSTHTHTQVANKKKKERNVELTMDPVHIKKEPQN
jgi:hypothetical protein